MKLTVLTTIAFLFLGTASMLYAQGTYDPEKKLADMGITLVPKGPGASNIVPAVRSGNLVFLSGHGPMQADGTNMTGKLGADLTVAQGREAARLTGIQLLNALKYEIGDLKKVKRIVKVLGMVNSTPDFVESPAVIHGFTDFMVEVFGPERGKHARSAVGMVSLPGGIAVEIEMIVEIED
ncbi:MAG: RidA family protein [Lunatimonas sp.]|uniref:RidA family protein n=1 Tax=Lunatimonas sp. TaxID=2060141 RepID=UPI00263B33A1|nr:RidA family protein [Lunatimonas sp.]MCC5937578.1 RidA family protein [Lunatimonas sp.]